MNAQRVDVDPGAASRQRPEPFGRRPSAWRASPRLHISGNDGPGLVRGNKRAVRLVCAIRKAFDGDAQATLPAGVRQRGARGRKEDQRVIECDTAPAIASASPDRVRPCCTARRVVSRAPDAAPPPARLRRPPRSGRERGPRHRAAHRHLATSETGKIRERTGARRQRRPVRARAPASVEALTDRRRGIRPPRSLT